MNYQDTIKYFYEVKKDTLINENTKQQLNVDVVMSIIMIGILFILFLTDDSFKK